jgi:predicted nucleic acid-binding protein
LTSCVLDTDVVIAALDRADAHHSAATALINGLAGSGTTLLLSLINYAEVLVRPAKDDSSLRIAIRAIEAMAIKLAAPTPAIARDAARLRGLNVSLADGFALATARAHSASIASFDLRVRRSVATAGLILASH